MKHSFSLIALDLRQQPEGHILKSLKNQLYFFDKRYAEEGGKIVYRHGIGRDTCAEELYGENIRIQAIVGKNGAGKTSLLDIIYRVINNLSFSILSKVQGQFTTLYFIEELYASLYYSYDNRTYCIQCHGQFIIWGEVDLVDGKDRRALFYSGWKKEKFNEDDLIKISEDLFYAIVTNYSPQALVSDDYKNETVSYYYKNKLHERDNTSWMPSLFHKNDGYKTPICLAPFREENGAINMSKEFRLTTYRLSSIFLYYFYNNQNDSTVIDSYALSDIQYEYRPAHSFEKFKKYNIDSKKVLHTSHNGTYGKRILELFDVLDVNLMHKCDVFRSGCEYLVAKVFSIVDTYQNYNRYKRLFFKRDSTSRTNVLRTGITSPLPDPTMPELLAKLVKKLNEDKSHITIKLRQALSLLQYILKCEENGIDYTWLSDGLQSFSFKDYLTKVCDMSSISSIEKLQALLPPPIFDIKITLQKKGDETKTPIALADLSSGEKQLLYVISTIVYHVLNLESIAKERDRVSYRNMFVMLDEVEICFHPDYQRQFINRLVNVIKDLNLNEENSFYILIATHSPFMLSDISRQNILYLKAGKDVSDEIDVNPFCANVNDVLAQSFFLSNGFSGEFAINKVKELMSFLKSKSKRDKKGWNIESAEYFIENMVGDPLLQSALRVMLKDKPAR